jgi:hypothetical protein
MQVTDRSPMSHEAWSGDRLTVLTDWSFAAADEYSARAALLHLSWTSWMRASPGNGPSGSANTA